MARDNSLAVWFGVILTVAPTRALAQTYQVSVEEAGALPTVYTKRFNWRYLTGYRHTTMVAKSGFPTLCSESACLDDDLPNGGLSPDFTRGGTATAAVSGMTAGQYRVELRYNQTANRTTSVPWTISTNAASNNSRSGKLDQRNTTPGAGNWLVLGQSDQNPIQVQSSATFVFGSDTITFNGSLSYGGIRLVRVSVVSDAGADASPSDAAADSSADSSPSGDAAADSDVAGDATPDAGPGGAGGGGSMDAALGDGGAGAGNAQPGVVPADDAGCGCHLEKPKGTGAPLAWVAAVAGLFGLTRRARVRVVRGEGRRRRASAD